MLRFMNILECDRRKAGLIAGGLVCLCIVLAHLTLREFEDRGLITFDKAKSLSVRQVSDFQLPSFIDGIPWALLSIDRPRSLGVCTTSSQKDWISSDLKYSFAKVRDRHLSLRDAKIRIERKDVTKITIESKTDGFQKNSRIHLHLFSDLFKDMSSRVIDILIDEIVEQQSILNNVREIRSLQSGVTTMAIDVNAVVALCGSLKEELNGIKSKINALEEINNRSYFLSHLEIKSHSAAKEMLLSSKYFIFFLFFVASYFILFVFFWFVIIRYRGA